MTTPQEDRRADVRQALRTKAQLLFSQGLLLDACTVNISATGIGIVTDGPIAPGTTFTLRCHLQVNGSRAELVTPVRVMHSVFSSSEGGFVVGLSFSGQSPEAARLLAASSKKA